MDDDIKKIIESVFSAEDAKLVHKMVEVVEKDMSESSKAKRMNELDYLLVGATK